MNLGWDFMKRMFREEIISPFEGAVLILIYLCFYLARVLSIVLQCDRAQLSVQFPRYAA